MKNEKGVATLFVLISGLFFITFIMGILILTSVKRETQLELGEEVQGIYNQNETQNALNRISIYTVEQLEKIGTGEKINIPEENRTYVFSETAQYILRNNLELSYNGILNLSQYQFDTAGKTIKIKDTSKPEETYYYYKDGYTYPVTKEGYKYEGLILQYEGNNNTGNGHDMYTSTWKDLSGNGNDGSLENILYHSRSGWQYGAIGLDGVDDGIYLGNKLKDIFKNNNTIEILTQMDELSARDIFIGNFSTANSINYEKDVNNALRAYINNGAIDKRTRNIITNNQETYQISYVFQHETNQIFIYVNGEQVFTSTEAEIGNYNYDWLNVWIGRDSRTGETSLKGKIYGVRIYNQALTAKEIENNYKTSQKTVKETPKETVNPPLVKEGMIPVYYDNGWKKADASKDNWYNYHETQKEWANVVTVKESGTKTRSYYQTSAEGTAIAEEDILAMFVWIPRYAYKINSGYHIAANGTGEIDIKFLNGAGDTYEGGTAVRQVNTNALTNGNKYVVHPAFTASNIGEEITGMWVGKFESSNASSPYNNEGITESSNENLKKGLGDGTTQDVTIRPNVTSWRWTEVTTMYDVCQAMNDAGNIHGLTSQTDTMMMKNSQWGSVAYLAQSKYGNKQGTDGESGIWNNPYTEGYIYENASNSAGYGMENYSTTLTGMAGETRDTGTSYYSKVQEGSKVDNGDSITIKYNNVNLVANGGGPNGTLGEEFTRTYYRYNTSNGVKASTTRNVYGIYDMSGGSWEVMASFLEKGTAAYTSELKTKPAKYIEQYSGNGKESTATDRQANYEANKDVYGDAVYETSSKGDGSQSGWHKDYSTFPNLPVPNFIRGGYCFYGVGGGLFCFFPHWSGTVSSSTFRVVAI